MNATTINHQLSQLSTYSTLHRHAAAAAATAPSPRGEGRVRGNFPASVKSAKSVVKSEPLITKYIIIATPDGTEVPILFPQVKGLAHSDVVPCGCSPVAAGFCLILGGTITIPDIGSSTLNLEPRPQDKQLISALLNH